MFVLIASSSRCALVMREIALGRWVPLFFLAFSRQILAKASLDLTLEMVSGVMKLRARVELQRGIQHRVVGGIDVGLVGKHVHGRGAAGGQV